MSKVARKPVIWQGRRVFCKQAVVGEGKDFAIGFNSENFAFAGAKLHSDYHHLTQTRRNRQASTETIFSVLAWHTVRFLKKFSAVWDLFLHPYAPVLGALSQVTCPFDPYQTNRAKFVNPGK